MTAASAQPAVPPSYHLLGRDGRYRWWRPILEIVLAGLFGLLGLLLLLVVTLAGPEPGPLADLFWANAPGALLLPAILLAVRLTGRPGAVTGVARRMRRRWLGACAARGLVVAVPVMLVWLVRSGGWQPGHWPGAATWWAAAGVAVVVVPLSMAATMYVNGWLLQVFGAWTGRAWAAVLLVAAVFLAIPSGDDPLVEATGVVVVATMCWLTIRTGGLEAALGLVVVHEVVAELVAQAQPIPAAGPVPPATPLDELPFVIALVGYTWWTVRAAARTPGIDTRPRRPMSVPGDGAGSGSGAAKGRVVHGRGVGGSAGPGLRGSGIDTAPRDTLGRPAD